MKPAVAREGSVPVESTELASGLGYGWAALLGLIQGLTEFLPVSSSGHLALAENLGGVQAEDPAFDILLHLATVVVVLTRFWRDVVRYWQTERRILGYIAAGMIPTAFGGVFFQKYFEALRLAPLAVCAGLVVSGGMLVAMETLSGTERKLKDLGYSGGVIIGLCQTLAIVPGISRSGATITGGVLSGLSRPDAICFSFLLMIPAVLGASCKKGIDLLMSDGGILATLSIGPSLLGFMVALVSGYVALILLIRLIEKRRLIYFAGYCFTIALLGFLYFGVLT